ncbi:MAG: LysR substrate-binding domain-containing protein [Pseudomonadota bacterium]
MNGPFRIQQIRQFLLIAANGSFRSAANGTFRSQSAVSIAMHDLEKQIGAALFEKGRNATLTPLAHALLPIFQELLRVHDRAWQDARQLAQSERGSIRLAVAPSLAEEWLPLMLKEFSKSHPDVRVLAIDEPSQVVAGLVASGDADLGISGFMDAKDGLLYQSIVEDSFGVICAQDHPFAKLCKSLRWDQMRNERHIGNATLSLLQGAGPGEWLDEPAFHITNRAALNACVRSGLGITFLPMLASPGRRSGLVFVPLIGPRITRQIGVIKRPGRTLLPAAEAMEALVIKTLRTFAKAKRAALR